VRQYHTFDWEYLAASPDPLDANRMQRCIQELVEIPAGRIKQDALRQALSDIGFTWKNTAGIPPVQE
jgi:hypothetical protein